MYPSAILMNSNLDW